MPLLSIKLDLVAALRETRQLAEPDPAQTALLAELGGADGIVVQLRRDRKHIRDRDLYLLKGICKTKLTLVIPPAEDIIERVLEVKPWMVILVADHPDSQSPVSTIDFNAAPVDFRDISGRFNGVGIKVGFYIEPEPEQIRSVTRNEAMAILINCLGYTGARTTVDAQTELDRIDKAVQNASRSGLEVYCGNGITYKNISPLIELGNIDEFIIGHAVCARAMLVGMERSVRDMAQIIRLPVRA